MVFFKRFLFSFSLCLVLVGCGKSEESSAISGLQEMAELGSVEYTVKKIIKTDDAIWYNKTFGTRKIIFTCTAYVKAGIDMKKFSKDKVVVDKERKSITLTLPQPEVLSFNMPPEEIKEEFSLVTGLRADFTPEDRQKLLVLGEENIRQDIPNMGILDDARANAETFFNALLSQAGYKTINVKFE